VAHRSAWGANRRTSIPAFALLSVLVASAPAFADGCKLGKIAEFPITMTNLRPLTTANIDDVDVRFMVDSGAFYSVISAASAAQLKLKTSPAPFGFEVTGVHGTARVSIATVKTFSLAGVSLHDVEFLVGGSEAGQRSIGVLGQNSLHIGDVEEPLHRYHSHRHDSIAQYGSLGSEFWRHTTMAATPTTNLTAPQAASAYSFPLQIRYHHMLYLPHFCIRSDNTGHHQRRVSRCRAL
jgi:hypothetical protein